MSELRQPPGENKTQADENVAGGGNVWTDGGDFVGRDQLIISGNVIVLNSPPDSVVAQLIRMINIQTELPPGPRAGDERMQTFSDRAGLQQSIDEVLSLFERAAREGVDARGVSAGQVQISRVELLLKKAILLRAEADESLQEPLDPDQPGQRSGRWGEVDMPAVEGEIHPTPRQAILESAYALLQEANQIDPVNTEVLLQQAELLVELTPEDPRDEERILRRVRKLLHDPKNDRERFHLAQASYLLGTTRDQVDRGLLKQARQIFGALGRSEWRQQCDDLLAVLPDLAHRVDQDSLPGSPGPFPTEGVFDPVGRWHFQVMDAAGSVLLVELDPNGIFRSVRQAGSLELNQQGSGQWAYNSFNHSLEIQGVMDNMQPFVLGIFIQGPQLNGFYGLGTDGNGYLITRI